MEQANWFVLPIVALLPLIIGFVWYHPNVMGSKLAQINGESLANNHTIGRVALIYVLSLHLAYILTLMSVHQSAIYQLFFMDPELANSNSEFNTFINDFMATYGNRHRSFGHGLIHGAEASLIFGLSFLGITTLMQGKPIKLIWIHLGFLILTCSLMAGLICAFF